MIIPRFRLEDDDFIVTDLARHHNTIVMDLAQVWSLEISPDISNVVSLSTFLDKMATILILMLIVITEAIDLPTSVEDNLYDLCAIMQERKEKSIKAYNARRLFPISMCMISVIRASILECPGFRHTGRVRAIWYVFCTY